MRSNVTSSTPKSSCIPPVVIWPRPVCLPAQPPAAESRRRPTVGSGHGRSGQLFGAENRCTKNWCRHAIGANGRLMPQNGVMKHWHRPRPCRAGFSSGETMQIVEHALNGVLLIEPACLVTNAGFLLKVTTSRRLPPPVAKPCPLCRTTTPAPAPMYARPALPDRTRPGQAGAGDPRRSVRRGGGSAPQTRPALASGPAIICPPPTSASCGCRPVLPMVFWWSAKPPSCCTKPLIFTGPSTSAASPGTTRS